MRIRVRGGAETLVGRWWNRGRVVGDAWWVAGGLCVRRIESLLGPQGPQQFTSVVVFLFCRTWPHHPHGHHTTTNKQQRQRQEQYQRPQITAATTANTATTTPINNNSNNDKSNNNEKNSSISSNSNGNNMCNNSTGNGNNNNRQQQAQRIGNAEIDLLNVHF